MDVEGFRDGLVLLLVVFGFSFIPIPFLTPQTEWEWLFYTWVYTMLFLCLVGIITAPWDERGIKTRNEGAG